jgi:hypothetical protein
MKLYMAEKQGGEDGGGGGRGGGGGVVEGVCTIRPLEGDPTQELLPVNPQHGPGVPGGGGGGVNNG